MEPHPKHCVGARPERGCAAVADSMTARATWLQQARQRVVEPDLPYGCAGLPLVDCIGRQWVDA